MRKYVKMQIIKHALEYYIQRPDVCPERLNQEKQALKEVTQEVENLKIAYNIESKMYVIEHNSGMIFRVETSSQKGALKKAFEQYKRLARRGDSYEVFKQNTTITEE